MINNIKIIMNYKLIELIKEAVNSLILVNDWKGWGNLTGVPSFRIQLADILCMNQICRVLFIMLR